LPVSNFYTLLNETLINFNGFSFDFILSSIMKLQLSTHCHVKTERVNGLRARRRLVLILIGNSLFFYKQILFNISENNQILADVNYSK